MKVGIFPEHIDFVNYRTALRDCPDIDMQIVEASYSHDDVSFPDIDVLIVQYVRGQDGTRKVLDHYFGNTFIIGLQSGVWFSAFEEEILHCVLNSNVFMPYETSIKHVAESLGIRIWRLPPLCGEKILNEFDPARKNYKSLFSPNIYHEWKLGFSGDYAKELGFRYVMYWDDNYTKVAPPYILDNMEFRPRATLEQYKNDLAAECHSVLQLGQFNCWGRGIIQAVQLGIPCVTNRFLQRVFYPGLYVNSLRDAKEVYSGGYDQFGPYVIEAQRIMQQLTGDPAGELFLKYLFATVNGKDPPIDAQIQWDDCPRLVKSYA